MTGENGSPPTPEWTLPKPVESGTAVVPPNIILGSE